MKAVSLRKGTIILYNNAPCKITEFFHNTPGKGVACVQVKMRNLITGLQTEQRFNSTADVPEADVFVTNATYLYKDGDGAHFMVADTFEQHTIPEENIDDIIGYLLEGAQVQITLFEDSPISVTPPESVTLEVVDTPPNLKTATATSSYKPAVLETGITVNIPPFIENGTKIVINTGTGEYVKRGE